MKKDFLVKGKFQIEKFDGKGAWHYVKLPIKNNPKNPFGWQQVKGKINSYVFSQYKLMPMGNGFLFLPIKKEIRKIENLKVGDWVSIEIFEDFSEFQIPLEIIETLKLESELSYLKFINLPKSRQRKLSKWAMQAKNIETKEIRLIKLIEELDKMN